MADDTGTPKPSPNPTPTPTVGGNWCYEGGESCNERPYFISVCETGFVDPVLRHTIVEAAATLHNCQICITCAEVAAAIEAIGGFEDLFSSKYTCSTNSEQTDSGTETYQDVTTWDEDSANSDFSLSDSTVLTCNTGGRARINCGLYVVSSGGSSSCSARLVRKVYEEDDYEEVSGTEITQATGTDPIELTIDLELQVSAEDKFKIQYKNDDGDLPHTIQANTSIWEINLIPTY